MNKIHVKVTNLQNNQMKTQIKNALEKLDGIQMVNVDKDRGSIEVGYNEKKAEESSIKACIEHVGCRIE